MGNVDVTALQKEVKQFLDIIEAYMETNSEIQWKPQDRYLPIVFRAVIRRQFDRLQAISKVVDVGIGYASGPLLRPACEEFIWIRYLTQIPRIEAQQLVHYFVLDESNKSLRKQDKFAGRHVTETLGLLPYLQQWSKRTRKEFLENLRELGKRLDWPESVIKNGRLPSVYWVAQEAGEKETYDYVYHATSRFVHFSIHELLRLAWGNPQTGTFSINSTYLNDYWSHFSLVYGQKLFRYTFATLLEEEDLLPVPPIERLEELQAIFGRIAEIGAPPIITAEELNWPKRDTNAKETPG